MITLDDIAREFAVARLEAPVPGIVSMTVTLHICKHSCTMLSVIDSSLHAIYTGK